MNKKYIERKNKLLPNSKPRYIRCYDNGGETADRYTVVYTGHYTQKTDRQFWFVNMNASPFHPQGIGMHGEHSEQIDRPTYSHLGKKITFDQLPEDCRKLVLQDYVYLWSITDHPLYSDY
jgi:hypothetical protein